MAYESAQSCGCDPGANYRCANYPTCTQGKRDNYERTYSLLDGSKLPDPMAADAPYVFAHHERQHNEDLMKDTVPATWTPSRIGPKHPVLPTDPKKRKEYPVFTGLLQYFPDACVAVAHVSFIGNEQHNPGQPLHWDRSKSMDQFDTQLRHTMEGGVDNDGCLHLAKAAWRALAALQLDIEERRARGEHV